MITTDWQFEIDDGVTSLTLGPGTPYHIYEFDHPKPDVRANETPRARADGTNRGRDYLGGVVIPMEFGIVADELDDPETVLDYLAALRNIWYGDNVRRTPGVRAVLKIRRPGREALRIYGRPGGFKPGSLLNASVGYVDGVMEFEADDGYLYSDELHSLSVPYVPVPLGGLQGELEGPWVGVVAGIASGALNVGGESPAWLTWSPHGPITNPEIEVVGRWSSTLMGSIAHDTRVTVDPSPWVRTARSESGANWAGSFKPGSTRMSRMLVPPGDHQVLLRGTDVTGTSYLDLSWRDTYTSI